MTMGFVANQLETVTWDFIQDCAFAQSDDFLATLDKFEVSLENFAQCFMWRDPESDELFDDSVVEDEVAAFAEISQAWERLRTAFAEKTTVGDSHLELFVSWHDKEGNGSPYDDVDGVIYSVSGVYQLSPAGQKFGEAINKVNFVDHC